MSRRLINTEIETYDGYYPTVFKGLHSGDVTKEEFQLNKQFIFMSGSSTSSVLPKNAIYTSYNNLPALGSELTYNDEMNVDGSLQSITYFSIRHLFYNNVNRNLFQSASIFYIPQSHYGDEIQKNSFTLNTIYQKPTSFNESVNITNITTGDVTVTVTDTSLLTENMIVNIINLTASVSIQLALAVIDDEFMVKNINTNNNTFELWDKTGANRINISLPTINITNITPGIPGQIGFNNKIPYGSGGGDFPIQGQLITLHNISDIPNGTIVMVGQEVTPTEFQVANENGTEYVIFDNSDILSGNEYFQEYPFITSGAISFIVETTEDIDINIKSNSKNELYDSNINTSSFATNCTFYEGFNTYFDTERIRSDEYNNLNIVPGITLSGSNIPIGYQCKFTSSSYIKTDIPGYYDRQSDYAISFFISGSNTSAENQLIIGKYDNKTINRYPFKVELTPTNNIEFSVSATSNLNKHIITSSSVTSTTHIVCQKSGSEISIWVDANKEVSGSSDFMLYNTNSMYTASGYINNEASVYIGGLSPKSARLTADLDEVRVFNTNLDQVRISSLNGLDDSAEFLQTNKVGDIFYKHGVAIITSPHYKYHDIINTNYTGSYKSTITTTEYSILASIRKDEFNLTTNPSVLQDNSVDYDTFITSSDFNPYITAVGLYNDYGQLLAVGKLAQPVKKRSDIDLNILVKFDINL